MSRRRSLTALLFAVGLILLAAPAGATAPAAKSGCKYLKLSEVNRITARTFAKGEPPPAPSSAAVCGYTVPDDPTTSVNLWVQAGPYGAAGFKASKEAFAANVEAVSGLGKKAFYAGGGVNTVYVLKGSTLIYVQYLSFGNADTAGVKAAAVEMTKVVTGRI